MNTYTAVAIDENNVPRLYSAKITTERLRNLVMDCFTAMVMAAMTIPEAVTYSDDIVKGVELSVDSFIKELNAGRTLEIKNPSNNHKLVVRLDKNTGLPSNVTPIH